MDIETLCDAATSASGLDDFGDPTFRDGLEVFIASVEAEAELSPIGAAAAEASTVRALRTRLEVTEWYRTHPEIAEESVVAPWFIVGMSRSGTTALSHLLSVDPANRSLAGWEAAVPVPPPAPDTLADDPRAVAAAAQEFGPLDQLNPRFKSIHHDPPGMPVECLVVMAQHFVALSLPTMFWIPTYTRWVMAHDHGPVYAWHETVLSLLQSGGVRGRWQLKSPHHPLALDAIVERYPDARFIVTHRDPATCVASTASLVRTLSSTFSDVDRPHEVAELWTDVLGTLADRLVEARERLGAERFVDVSYRALVEDPLGAVEGLYAGLDTDLSGAARAAMAAHVAEHVQHRHGRHDYGLEDFGLERGALDERFASYRERFAPHLR
ncbi:MAG: sulfotransferase [Acidimicrobiales bacterium]|nr:sulfotransferase [Acidimicrobiales bacterium]